MYHIARLPSMGQSMFVPRVIAMALGSLQNILLPCLQVCKWTHLLHKCTFLSPLFLPFPPSLPPFFSLSFPFPSLPPSLTSAGFFHIPSPLSSIRKTLVTLIVVVHGHNRSTSYPPTYTLDSYYPAAYLPVSMGN